MEITVTTAAYTAQELQQELNPRNAFLCIVLGGNHANEFIVMVDNGTSASLVKGMLKHLGITILET